MIQGHKNTFLTWQRSGKDPFQDCVLGDLTVSKLKAPEPDLFQGISIEQKATGTRQDRSNNPAWSPAENSIVTMQLPDIISITLGS